MGKVQKPSNSECYTPSSEPFRINFCYSSLACEPPPCCVSLSRQQPHKWRTPDIHTYSFGIRFQIKSFGHLKTSFERNGFYQCDSDFGGYRYFKCTARKFLTLAFFMKSNIKTFIINTVTYLGHAALT
jgi:hypothetical protein